MAKGKKKEVKRPLNVGSKVTVKEKRNATDSLKPIWRFDWIDRSGEFAFDTRREKFDHREVLEKMINYSGMSWAEIKRQTHDDGKSKHHMLNTDSLSKAAMDRLRIKKLEEYSDSIFSFALQNKLRIIGIREKEFFYVIWYDSEHQFCPSTKKNT